jgi:phage shock protein E
MYLVLNFAGADWRPALVVGMVLAALLVLKRGGMISAKDARACLQRGALVIDVRTHTEFSSGHLPGAINLPLDEIESSLPRRVQDRKKVLLLHCQSGMRSMMAKKRLRSLGYANVFNLGSYGRAASIVKGE